MDNTTRMAGGSLAFVSTAALMMALAGCEGVKDGSEKHERVTTVDIACRRSCSLMVL